MPAGLTSTAVVNAALEQVATQVTITSLSDGTTPANLANVVYAPLVQLLLRELDPDFARFTATLASSGAATPIPPWAYEYLYPADCVRLRQVRPANGAYDPNDPQPVRSAVAFDLISSVNTKVILTNQASALAVYTSSTPTEAQWDSAFAETMVRRLSNPLAMGLSGRPDFAKTILESAAMQAQTAEMTDDGAMTPLPMPG